MTQHTDIQPTGDQFVSLTSSKTQLILDAAKGSRPSILYWGPLLRDTKPAQLALLSVRQWAFGGPTIDISSSLSNELGAGIAGPPGFLAHRAGGDWSAVFRVVRVSQRDEHGVEIICEDANTKIGAIYRLTLNADTGVLTADTEITNDGDKPLSIDWCTALCMPLDKRLSRLMGFTGRWAGEFQQQEITAFRGSYVRENKSGRTSHNDFPALIAMTPATDEASGLAVGLHLGWSGNNRVRADHHSDGRGYAQLGELFFPGEMTIAGGESYRTPPLYAGWSESGLSGLSQQFHDHLKAHVMDRRTRSKRRPIHYNTWEAVYFDHSEEKLFSLAEKAAAIGAERFVLDDGWFGARRDDRTGLGDWHVSPEVYPNGLGPLSQKVRSLGMEFGLWFEPEMVNPDSELYRAHPDWVLKAPGVDQIPSRQQLALDLTRPEVSDYLYDRVSAIVSENDVAYIKWDMNRDIQHPGSSGRAAIHRQTLAVYALMERLRTAHPTLEIESCSSGGARADYGVLRYTDRIWTSDSNDALDRQAIQRGASYFFPLNVMGAHVGPRKCHITGRVLPIAFRAATAFFGHMGMELNLLDEEAHDLEVLKEAIALHKHHRQLLHGGDFFRLDLADYLSGVGVVAKDQSEALFSIAKTNGHGTTLPERCHFIGLASAKCYRLRLIWPTGEISVTAPSIVEAADLTGDGVVASGEALLVHGVQLPLMLPNTCLIYHLESAEGDAL